MKSNRPLQVRREARGRLVSLRSRKHRPGPRKVTIYDQAGKRVPRLRVRVQKFPGEGPGELARDAAGLLQWVHLGEPSTRDIETKPPSLNEIPALAKLLRQQGFSPDQPVWPLEFGEILAALGPTIHRIAYDSTRAPLRFRTQKQLFQRIADCVWAGIRDNTETSNSEYWQRRLRAALRNLLTQLGSADVTQDDTPRSPGEWFAHDLRWTRRVHRACEFQYLTATQTQAVLAYASWLYGWMDFSFRRPSSLGQDNPMTLGEFSDEVFFPALEEALSESFGTRTLPKTTRDFPAHPDLHFQRSLYHHARLSFNRHRTHWRTTKTHAGRRRAGAFSEEADIDGVAERVSRHFTGRPLKKTMAIRTLIALLKEERRLPAEWGPKERRSTAYANLAKRRRGVRVEALRKRVHSAKEILRKSAGKGYGYDESD